MSIEQFMSQTIRISQAVREAKRAQYIGLPKSTVHARFRDAENEIDALKDMLKEQSLPKAKRKRKAV